MLETIFSADTLWWILIIVYIPACFGLIVIVLLQKGKGAGFACRTLLTTTHDIDGRATTFCWRCQGNSP